MNLCIKLSLGSNNSCPKDHEWNPYLYTLSVSPHALDDTQISWSLHSTRLHSTLWLCLFHTPVLQPCFIRWLVLSLPHSPSTGGIPLWYVPRLTHRFMGGSVTRSFSEPILSKSWITRFVRFTSQKFFFFLFWSWSKTHRERIKILYFFLFLNLEPRKNECKNTQNLNQLQRFHM